MLAVKQDTYVRVKLIPIVLRSLPLQIIIWMAVDVPVFICNRGNISSFLSAPGSI